MARVWIWFSLVMLLFGGSATGQDAGRAPLFAEAFDDDQLLKRNWYDGTRFTIAQDRPKSGAGCIEYAWQARGTTPSSSSGLRRIFPASETVFLKTYWRMSADWGWTERGYHPHLMHFLTTENGPWAGPAATHLTVYIEPWNGRLRLAAQDIQNQDQPHGLTQGPLKGGFNGQMFDSQDIVFRDAEWHCVEALFQLNTLNLAADQPNRDGIVRGWVDGKLVVDRTNVVLRSTDFPRMKFNQFLLTPYFGPGLLPHAQTLWVDELSVSAQR